MFPKDKKLIVNYLKFNYSVLKQTEINKKKIMKGRLLN